MLKDVLIKKRNSVLGKWLELIAVTLPSGSRVLDNKDKFTNPLGHTFFSEIEVLYDEFLNDRIDSEEAAVALDAITRIMAVQEFSPGQAVGFVFSLKKAIRDELKGKVREKQAIEEMPELEAKIDEMACLAFNAYTNCRERLYRIRLNEIKSDRDNAFKLMERSAMKWGAVEEDMAGGYNGSEVTE